MERLLKREATFRVHSLSHRFGLDSFNNQVKVESRITVEAIGEDLSEWTMPVAQIDGGNVLNLTISRNDTNDGFGDCMIVEDAEFQAIATTENLTAGSVREIKYEYIIEDILCTGKLKR